MRLGISRSMSYAMGDLVKHFFPGRCGSLIVHAYAYECVCMHGFVFDLIVMYEREE